VREDEVRLAMAVFVSLVLLEGGLVGPPEERSAEIENSEGLSD
jgi:hypothetical protein